MAKIGKYELVRQLATGGMAEVFLAKTEGALGFEKTVVLKRISPHLLGDPQFLEMFLQEAKLAAQLNHPNIAQVFDFGESNGDYFLAMEHVDGPNLRALFTQAHKAGKPIPYPLGAKIVSYACEGLAFAHEFTNPKTGRPLNIVHRDVSPDNIMLAKNGAVKVVDFGIAKAAEQLYQTQSGYRKGKLAYMSPEYLKGNPPDRRVDVYALGVVLYELISNRRPYDAENEITLMHAMIYEPMVPIRSRRADVPEELERIVDRALQRDPDERYGSCRELQAALERYIVDAGEPLSSVHVSKVIAGLQPELDAAAAALKTPNRKSTPSGRTPSGPKTPPKKAAGTSGEKRKGSTPPRPITFKDVGGSEERTVELDGPGMVAKAVAIYGEGASSEATQEITAQDVAAQEAVVARKIEPAPPPPTEDRTSPALDVRPVVPPRGGRRSGPKPAGPSPKPVPGAPAVLVVTRKQLVAAGAVAFALMLMAAGIAVMVVRPASPPPAPAQAAPATPPAPTARVESPPPPPVEKPSETPKPQKVVLEVTPGLQGMVVQVGKQKATAPPYRFELRPGWYTVLLEDPVSGATLKQKEVELKAGDTAHKLKIDLGRGTAVFSTIPPLEAAVYVDHEAKPRCNTLPCTIPLSEGAHSAKFVSPKRPKPDERQFTVPAGKSVGVVASFP